MSRILVADDDTDVRDVVTAALRRAGHDVRQAADGFEALEIALHEPVDALVLDVIMPGRTGIDVVVALRADLHRQQPGVLLMSSLGSRTEVRDGFLAGADDYLAKPFSPNELVDRVALLLLERGTLAGSA